jgi:hypothetical protein
MTALVALEARQKMAEPLTVAGQELSRRDKPVRGGNERESARAGDAQHA